MTGKVPASTLKRVIARGAFRKPPTVARGTVGRAKPGSASIYVETSKTVKSGEIIRLHQREGVRAGISCGEKPTKGAVRAAIFRGVRTAMSRQAKTINLSWAGGLKLKPAPQSPSLLVRRVAKWAKNPPATRFGIETQTGLVAAAVADTYRYDRLQTKKKTTPTKKGEKKAPEEAPSVERIVVSKQISPKNVRAASIIGEAVCDARDLGNLREDEGTPNFYVEWAKENICKEPNVRMTDLLVGEQLQKRGLLLHHAVGRQAVHPPALAVMEYKGARPHNKKEKKVPVVAIVGKGVTFDSGGMNVKPFGNMETMHMDMMGAGAVLATMRAVARLKLPINVIGAVGLAENAIGPEAFQPSSIITSLKGTTVEITNTDAEGRLVLADALTFVQDHAKVTRKPDVVIDLATLTGAMLIALGSSRAGAFGNSKELIDTLVESGYSVDEPLWPMPIAPEHDANIRGMQSDITNCVAGREAGACTAAAFLKEFINKDVQWAHLDIAGPGMGTKGKGVLPDGAPGFGVRLLINYLATISRTKL